jgi:NAD(P)-dependent dehydrogenase (short-subunit alcohol dehydrogenase family)
VSSPRSRQVVVITGASDGIGRATVRRRSEPGTLRIDRLVGNLRTGPFERSLSALTAVGAPGAGAEICPAHDGASFGTT